MKQKLLTVPEAAELLNITARAAWMRVYRNQIPHKRWGHKVVISSTELENFINSLPGPSAKEAAAKVEDHAT